MMSPKRTKQTRKNLTPQKCTGSQGQETDRSQRVFLADMRDRLRAPVSAIIGYGELLLEDAREQGRADLTVDLTKIHSLGRKLYSLVDASLDETALLTERTETFSSNLRHELRTPLNAIIGYSELLIEDAIADGSEAFVSDLEKIRSAGKQFLSGIDEISGFTSAGPGAANPAAALSETKAMVSGIMKDIPSPDISKMTSLSAARGSLLVVDDTEISRDLLQRQLERQGHIVMTAGSGKQALEILQSRTFDLVLLDIMMPDMSGYQVLQRLKNSDLYGDIPVIIVSALDDMDSVV